MTVGRGVVYTNPYHVPDAASGEDHLESRETMVRQRGVQGWCLEGGGNPHWVDGAPPRTFAAWLEGAAAGEPEAEAVFLSPRLSLGGLATLRRRLARPARLRILVAAGAGPRVAPEAPHYTLLATTPAELVLDHQLTQGVDARALHRWLAQGAIEIRTIALPTALPAMAAVGDALAVGNVELTRECLDPAQTMPEAGLLAPDAASRDALMGVFERLWEQGEDAKERLRKALDALTEPQSPRFLYFLTLWHLFHERLPEWRGGLDDDRRLDETPIWQALYAFQRHGAIAALRKIRRDGGCVLADSVGLGKTYTALAVIKAFEREGRRVLVLCPKKLRPNWLAFLQDDAYNPFLTQNGRADFSYALLNHTDLSREWADPGRGMARPVAEIFARGFDLIVIDESHNFRNAGGKRYQFLLDHLKAHPKTTLLMLSATPVSNRMADLTNQLGLIRRAKAGEERAFDRAVTSVVATAQRKANAWNKTHADDPQALSAAALAGELPEAYFRLLERYTIARSREGILRGYADAEQELGSFPQREAVHYYPEIDTANSSLDIARLSDTLANLSLVAYNPVECLRAGIAWQERTNLTAATRQRSLAALMRINALKRLESSVDAFRKTLREAILARTEAMLKDLDKGIVHVSWSTAVALVGKAEASRHARAAQQNVPGDMFDDSDTELTDELEGKDVALPAETYFDTAALKKWLERDRKALQEALDSVEAITSARDAKLQTLIAALRDKAAHPLNPGNEKALVFTAFADTADYVARQLAAAFPGRHIACVTGSTGLVLHGGKATGLDMGAILRRFAPVAQTKTDLPPDVAPIDWVVATDCLSEGQNLQDCDWVCNYDIHWNPLRLVQRAGRVDRLGSRNTRIQIALFWPCKTLDGYIGLERTVRAKNAVGALVAADSNALDDTAKQDLAYRQRQLDAIKHSRFDLDAFFTDTGDAFADYLGELDAWLRADKTREAVCAKAPLGLYAITPAALTEALAKNAPPVPTQGGALFLLRRAGLSPAEAAANPLGDCFLLAADADGRPLGAPHPLTPEQTLALLRALCRDRTAPDPALHARFDALGPKALTPALEGALDALGLARETNRAKLLLGDAPFDFHTGLTDDRAALTLLTFALILPDTQSEKEKTE